MSRTSVARAGRGILKGFLLLVCLTGTAWAQRGALVVHRNLGELTDRAAVIVRGRVVEARVEKHPEFTALHTIVVTLRVTETLKGDTAPSYTFRQYIWDLRDRRDVAGYRKGQEYVLLMNAPNEHGLTSPAGMEQGRFRIYRDRNGVEVSGNGHGNFGLFRGLDAQLAKRGRSLTPQSSRLVKSHRSGPIPAAELTRVIRELVAGGASQ